MAEENISDVQRQLTEAMSQVQRDLAQFGRVTQQSAEQLKDAEIQAATGLRNFTKVSNTAGQALGALAGAGVESAKAMYEGKKGMGAFNSSLDELSKAAVLAGTALTLLIPGGIVIKAIVGGLTMAATAAIAYTKAANDMSDKLYKSYSGLQQSGAAASDGMTGVFRDAKKLGLSMDQLDSMVTLVAANSQELALMSGSVSQGRKDFAKMGEALESSRAGFFKMGISQEAQNEALMRYTRNQTLAGRAQNMTTKEMADGARAYIYEQDKLAKLTGMSAQKQQELLDRARENEQFNAKLRKLELEGTAESLAAAERLKQGLQIAAMAGDESAEAFMASVNGNLRSEAARKANLTTSGAYLQYARDLESGAIIDAAKGFEKVASAGADYEKSIGVNLSALDAGANIQLKTSTMQKLALINQIGLEAAQKKIDEDQLKQQKGQGDGITNAQGNMIKKQQDINKKLEEDVFKGIPNAQANMGRLANVTDKLADAFTHLTNGINRLLNLVGLGEKEPEKPKEMTRAEIEAAAVTEGKRDAAKPIAQRVDALNKEIEENEKKLKDAKRAGKYGEEERKLEEKILADKKQQEEIAKQLIAAEEDIKKSKLAEQKLQAKKMSDVRKLGQLERDNLMDSNKIKDLNEEKANLIKAGKDTSAVDKKIEARRASIAGRSAEVGQLQADLKTTTVAPKSSGQPGQPGGAKPEDVLKFSGESGQRENFDKLNEGMKSSLLAAAQQYHEQTGQKLQMNSGARSPEDQKRLYDETEKAGRPGVGPTGMPVAKPGRSSHETGNAVDIQNYTDPKALAALGANGLRQTVPKDPVHFQIEAADGGAFSGPDSGYPATLHGEEAVIPLNNSGGNFVQLFEQMAMMMGQQAGALEELVRVAKNGNDISTKILHSAN